MTQKMHQDQKKIEISPERILLIHTAFLGDLVLTTPLITALKSIFPESDIYLLTTPTGAELLDGLKELKKIIVYDKRGKEKGIFSFFSKIKEIRNMGFELVISPHRSFRSSFIALFSKTPQRIGFDKASLSSIYNFQVPFRKELNEVERNLELLKPVGGIPSGFKPELKLPLNNSINLEKFGLKNNHPKVAIAPGSRWETKRWTTSGYAKLCELIVKEFGAMVYILGTDEDKEVADEIEKKSDVPIINLAGKTSIPELLALMKEMKMLVANDSGSVHIASALKVPVVAIFGPTVPEQGFAPYGTKHIIVQNRLKCAPCSAHGPRKCPEGHFRCMKELKAEQVFDAVRKLWNG